MSGTLAIIKKEVKTYFYSPLAYVLLGIFLFVMGLIFAKFVAIYVEMSAAQRFGQQQSLTLDKLAGFLFQNMAFILCFVTPFLTMKLFAEEKSQSTLELLLTAPIHTSGLVVGKFLGAFFLMGLMVLLSFVYPFFMILWGNPEIALIASTYLGLLLSLACYVALGALISALASTQAVAAAWTFILLLLLWLLQSLGQGITASWGPIELGPALIYLSPLGHFNSFNEGLIQLKDLVYFVSFIFFALFLTHRVVESNRWR
jgi:ABC-2 type transport system permease protein